MLESSVDGSSDKELEPQELDEILSKLKESMQSDVRQAAVWNTLGLILLKSGRLQVHFHYFSFLIIIAFSFLTFWKFLMWTSLFSECHFSIVIFDSSCPYQLWLPCKPWDCLPSKVIEFHPFFFFNCFDPWIFFYFYLRYCTMASRVTKNKGSSNWVCAYACVYCVRALISLPIWAMVNSNIVGISKLCGVIVFDFLFCNGSVVMWLPACIAHACAFLFLLQ